LFKIKNLYSSNSSLTFKSAFIDTHPKLPLPRKLASENPLVPFANA